MDELKDNSELQEQIRKIIEQELKRIGFGGGVCYLSGPHLEYHPQGIFQIESNEPVKTYEDPPIEKIKDTVREQLGVVVSIKCVPSGTDITDWSPYSDAG
jgi:hypothetical protein